MRYKQLENVPEENTFRLKSGQQIKNLYELSIHLAGMDDDTFQHHVNDEKNDFRNWIFDIVKDDRLADRLAGTKDRAKMAKIVEKRVTAIEQEKKHHAKVLEQGFKWGIKEFSMGLVTGLFIGLVFLRALGRI